MGTKFANLHIKSGNLEEVIDVLSKFNYPGSYFVGKFGSWISIFGENYNWETIGNEAQLISKLLKYPVLSVGYFDDDVLEIGLYENNLLITSLVAGFGVEDYGLEPDELNKHSFEKVLNTNLDAEELENVLENDDISEQVEGLQKLLNIPLWMKYDWIEDDTELIEQFKLLKI